MDPREMPAYTLAEASHYLFIPRATLRSWCLGRYYPVSGGRKFFKPVVDLPDQDQRLLSFTNLVEAHVLNAIRRRFQVPLPAVRQAINYLRKHLASERPLADQKLQTNGQDLFVEKFGQLINVSHEGQLAMKSLIEAHLQRIEWDRHGFALRLFPFTRLRESEVQGPRVVVIDPYISFGKPVLVGTGIRTEILAERYKAGDSIGELASDYAQSPLAIEEAIRCELVLQAA